jgi:fructuronate reductase
MVDRIVPATTDSDIAAVESLTGRHDAAPVMHEPFRQWVIEDDFVDGARPAFEATSAQLVREVTPFELMKLRCLNGTHSSLAYLGYLAGHETIADTVADRPFADFARQLWDAEIVPTLATPEGEDLPAYTASLLERYRNPGIRHRTWQIAMDGTQKLPQRILGTVADNLAAGRPVAGLSLAVAAWMRYVGGVDEKGQPIDVKDPLADRLCALSDAAEGAEGKVAALLSVREVFTERLAAEGPFRSALVAAYSGLVSDGARAMVERTAP